MTASSDKVGRRTAPHRRDFVRFVAMPTRWADNDAYGHVNNVQYYAFFDTAVNQSLMAAGLLDLAESRVVGLVVETSCTYFSSVAFPDLLDVGMVVERIGTSSLTYRLGIFRAGHDAAAAEGRFTHVYVDRTSQTPVPVPAAIRAYAGRMVLP